MSVDLSKSNLHKDKERKTGIKFVNLSEQIHSFLKINMNLKAHSLI